MARRRRRLRPCSTFGETLPARGAGQDCRLGDRELTWHFVGRVQANRPARSRKPSAGARTHRLRIAERLAAQRRSTHRRSNVCLQVNLAQERTKGGVTPAELPPSAAAVARLPRLALRGLMCIPPEESEPARQRAWFARPARASGAAQRRGARLDTLSMGMSGDFEAAIAEGATIVRLGRRCLAPALPRRERPSFRRRKSRPSPAWFAVIDGLPGESATGAFA